MNDEVENSEERPIMPASRSPLADRGDVSWRSYSNQWNENHGTALMMFAGLIFLVGGGFIYFQQNRFRPPAFPSSDAIQGVKTNLVDPVADPDWPTEDEFDKDPDASNRKFDQPNADSSDPDSDPEKPAARPAAKPASDAGESLSLNEANSSATNQLKISGAAKGGLIRIAFYHSKDNFNDATRADWKQAIQPTGNGQANCEIPPEAMADQFAIAVYHDQNENKKLDRNAFGLPSEPYGFSNGARGKLGPPAFTQAAMQRPPGGQSIEVKIW